MFENKYSAATSQLQDLIRAHPQDAKDHATYALVLNYQTKQKPALDEALKAQKLAPNDGFVLTVLTRAEDWNNDLPSAARDGAAAIKAASSSATQPCVLRTTAWPRRPTRRTSNCKRGAPAT